MNNPLISVIVPVYNSEQYLHRCIDSILSQTHTNFELLLINDGSTDTSGIICDEYATKDTRIRVFHKSNGGVSSARNLGLEHAKGKYISFVDSDDEIYPNYLSILLHNIKECDFSYIGVLQYDLDTQKTYKWTNFEDSIFIINATNEEKIFKNNLLEVGFPFGKIFDKDIINNHKLRFNEHLNIHEDHIFTLQYLRLCEKISISKEYGYIWNVQSNSNSLSHGLKDWQQLVLASRMMDELFNYQFQHCSIRKEYRNYLRSKYVTGNIRASVYYLYKTHNDDSTRTNALKEITPLLRSYLNKYSYQPINFKHRIIAIFLASHLPIKLKHIVLKHLYK